MNTGTRLTMSGAFNHVHTLEDVVIEYRKRFTFSTPGAKPAGVRRQKSRRQNVFEGQLCAHCCQGATLEPVGRNGQ